MATQSSLSDEMSASGNQVDTPSPEIEEADYQTYDGVKYLLGPYSFDQRKQYFAVIKSLYKTRHPEATNARCKRVAMNKWRLVVAKSKAEAAVTDLQPSDSKPSTGHSEASSKSSKLNNKGAI